MPALLPNFAHLAFNGAVPGTSYTAIYYANSTTGSFAAPIQLAAGWYSSGNGNYFQYALIKVSASSYSYIAYRHFYHPLNDGQPIRSTSGPTPCPRAWCHLPLALLTSEKGGRFRPSFSVQGSKLR